MKKQCKNKFVFNDKEPLIYFCIREKGHAGLHKGTWIKTNKRGKILKKKDFWWN